MDTRKREITKADLHKTLSLDSLFENIRLNKTIPNYLERIRENHTGVQQLLKAIEAGDSEAAIFDQPHCYIYLLHLLEENKITDSVFLTVYFYLMALMQYTNRQPIKFDDHDVKVTRDFRVDKLVEDGKLTNEAKIYIAIVTQRMADFGYSIDQIAVRKFILDLPPTEQWLLRIKSIKDLRDNWYLPHGRSAYYSSESLQGLMSGNIPFITTTTAENIIDRDAVRNKRTSIWVPSVSIMQYMLCVVSPRPLCMKPVFGIAGLEKLHTMHAHHEHPIELYACDVKSNLYDVDSYRAGPLVAALHDIFHAFSGSLLRPVDREAIFSYVIPFVESISNKTQSTYLFDEMIRRLGDFDLSPTKKFLDPATRFETYLKKNTRYNRYHNGESFLMMHKAYNEARLPANQQLVINHLVPRVSELKTLDDIMLILLADNKLHSHINLDEYNYMDKLKPVNWLTIKKLLNKYSDPSELFQKLRYEHRNDFFTLVIQYGARFYHPIIPLTNEKRQQLESLVDRELAKLHFANQQRVSLRLYDRIPATKHQREGGELMPEKPNKRPRK